MRQYATVAKEACYGHHLLSRPLDGIPTRVSNTVLVCITVSYCTEKLA